MTIKWLRVSAVFCLRCQQEFLKDRNALGSAKSYQGHGTVQYVLWWRFFVWFQFAGVVPAWSTGIRTILRRGMYIQLRCVTLSKGGRAQNWSHVLSLVGLNEVVELGWQWLRSV